MNIDHMDTASRNARLYEHLKSMGLYVIPVFVKGGDAQIDHFHVSAGLPAYLTGEDLTEQTASGAIPAPVTSAEIVKLIRTPER